MLALHTAVHISTGKRAWTVSRQEPSVESRHPEPLRSTVYRGMLQRLTGQARTLKLQLICGAQSWGWLHFADLPAPKNGRRNLKSSKLFLNSTDHWRAQRVVTSVHIYVTSFNRPFHSLPACICSNLHSPIHLDLHFHEPHRIPTATFNCLQPRASERPYATCPTYQ